MDENNEVNRATPADAGCWLEGSRGWRITADLIDLAESRGMNLCKEDRDGIDLWRTDLTVQGGQSYTDMVIELADEAEEWMNREIAPEGYSFGWQDGEFFLWKEVDWQE